MNLLNKVCVVTGAAKGIGFAIADRLATNGAKVVLCDVDQPSLESAINKLGGNKDNVKLCTLDVASDEQAASVVREIEDDWGPISVWINNAGVARHVPIVEIDEKDVDLMMDVNVKGTILGSKHALKSMKKIQHGHIINIISTAGINGIPNQSVYSASKFAVRGFSEALRQEASPMGIKVTSIFPGGVDTEFWDKAQEQRPPRSIFLNVDQVAKSVMQVLEMDDDCLAHSLVIRSIRDVDFIGC